MFVVRWFFSLFSGVLKVLVLVAGLVLIVDGSGHALAKIQDHAKTIEVSEIDDLLHEKLEKNREGLSSLSTFLKRELPKVESASKRLGFEPK